MEVLDRAESVAQRAAAIIAEEARAAVAARGRFVMAVSGGRTPWLMLRALGSADVPWPAIHLVQVDERVAPAGHPDRNLTHLRESLLEHAPLVPEQIYAMPVESSDLEAAAREYDLTLRGIAGTRVEPLPYGHGSQGFQSRDRQGAVSRPTISSQSSKTILSPAVLDLVHLGLGPDGHTASLVPGDPVLKIENADVAMTGIYQGRRRMTLTYPIINRSRRILWVVTGGEKADMLNRLLAGDESIPAGRVRRDRSVVIADEAAAGQLKGA
jgi:6-phosphogluconolactonase